MRNLILDAGHGGIIGGVYTTAGKRSPEIPPGVYEGEQNRVFCSKLAFYLTTSISGLKTYFNLDWFSESLSERKRRYSQWQQIFGPSFLISAHTNASGNEWSSAEGLVVFIPKKPLIGKKDKYEISKNMAEAFLREMKARTKQKIRGIQEKNFDILTGDMPGMLIERWFHTNKVSCSKAMALDVEQINALIPALQGAL